MAGIPIPQEMLPRMDWHAENKSAAWEHFTTRLRLYYTVAHTPKEVQVNTILFFVVTEATDRWKTLKEQMSAEDQASSDKVFEAFTNSFEKSSSYWQAREEYLSDIKQNKQQTTAELDIYIKDLVRRCQFTRAEVEARKTTDREDHRVASHSSSREEEEARAVASSSRKALPTST